MQQAGTELRRRSGKAIASLVLGIGGLLLPPLGIAALVYGYRAQSQILETRPPLTGDGMALVGIILGWLGTIYTGFCVLLLLLYVFG